VARAGTLFSSWATSTNTLRVTSFSVSSGRHTTPVDLRSS
jgi:hypothetical protein